MKSIVQLVLHSCLILILFPATAAAERGGEFIPDSYIVIFRGDVPAPAAVAQDLARAHGLSVRHVYQHALRGMAVRLPANAQAQGPILTALQRDPRVRAVGQDIYLTAFQTVSKGVRRISGDPGKPVNAGNNILVAILDTGLDFNHPDLAANIDGPLSRNCISSNGSPGCVPGGQDDNGHGTFVGGNVAAVNNSIDVVGVAHGARLIAVKVLDSGGSGSFGDITAAVDYLTGVRLAGAALGVANMSLGARCSVCTDGSTHPTVQAFQIAVRGLVNAGTTVVVAAGNDGVDASTTIPAAFAETVTVSALADTDGEPGGSGSSILIPGLGWLDDDSFAKFSNHGAPIDVIAPGVNELSLRLGGGTRTGSGTSYSAPYTAGVAAIFIRDHLDRTGTWPGPELVRRALVETGECAEGAGTVFHNGAGCASVWPGDPDGIPEPLVRADRVHRFSAAPFVDVAVTSLTVSDEVVVDTEVLVEVGVVNNGTDPASLTVTLETNPASAVSGPQGVALSAGASATVSFSWTPTATGSHILTATVSGVVDDADSGNDSMSRTVSVIAASEEPPEPDLPADLAVNGITPNSMPRATTIGVTITGAGFVSGASIAFEGSGPAPTASGVSVSADGTVITASVSSKSGGGPSARTYDLVVRNPDGRSARLSNALTVTP
jgi:subtilisin